MTLPVGWVETTIDEIAQSSTDGPFGSGLKSDHYRPSGIRVIRLNNLGVDRFLPENSAFIDASRADELARHDVRGGDLVTAALGEPLGRSSIVPGGLGPTIVKADCFRTRILDPVIARFVVKWLNSPVAQADFEARSQGIGRVRISLSGFRATRLPLPPLAEQRRIVAKLDTLTARLTRARIELGRVAALASSSRSAAISMLLAKMNVYDGVPLGETVAVIFDGPFGSNLKSSDYTAEGARVVRLENIGRLRFIGEKRTYVSLEKYAGLTRHTLKADDILFSSFVDEQTRVCRFPANIAEPAINKADCFAIRVDPAKFDPRLLTFVLGSPETFSTLKAHVHGATRPRVNIGILKSLVINLPPIAVQKKLADEVETAFARADRLEAEAARACALIDRLEAAILARAFRGELVPQAPADEHASVLLDRIRTERPVAPTAKRGRRSIPSGAIAA